MAVAERRESQCDRDEAERRIEAVPAGKAHPAGFGEVGDQLRAGAADEQLERDLHRPAGEQGRREQHRLAPQPQEQQRGEGGETEQPAQQRPAERGDVAHRLEQPRRADQLLVGAVAEQPQPGRIEPGDPPGVHQPGDQREADPAQQARRHRPARIDPPAAHGQHDGFGGERWVCHRVFLHHPILPCSRIRVRSSAIFSFPGTRQVRQVRRHLASRAGACHRWTRWTI